MARGRPAALLVADRSGVAALLRQSYERLERDGVSAIADLLDPEFEIETARDLPEGGTYRGVEDFEKLVANLADPFDEIRLETGEIVELPGGLFVVQVHIQGRGKLSGLPLDAHVVHVWTMRDGKALQLRVFTDLEEALEAARSQAGESRPRGSP